MGTSEADDLILRHLKGEDIAAPYRQNRLLRRLLFVSLLANVLLLVYLVFVR